MIRFRPMTLRLICAAPALVLALLSSQPTAFAADRIKSSGAARTPAARFDLGPITASIPADHPVVVLTPADWDDPSAKHWKDGPQAAQDLLRPVVNPQVPHPHPGSAGAGLGPMLHVPPRALDLAPPPAPRKMQR